MVATGMHRRGWSLVGAALVALGWACAGPAGEPEAAGGRPASALEAYVTLSYRRVPLERVLDYLSRATRGINIKVSVNDPAREEELKRMLVTVELTNVTWRTALEYIAEKYRFVINGEKEGAGVILLEQPPRIKMSVQDAPIETVIKMIAAESRANIIIGPEVQGNVTFDIHDVPWKEALESILKTQGYIKVEEASGIIRITTPERVQTQHEVRAVNLKYIQPEGTRFSPVIESEYVTRSGGGADGGEGEFSLLGVLNQIKSPEGSISYERRTNTLIIKDTATRIEDMLAVIQQIDRVPLQVKIAVRILTHNIDGDEKFGVDWTNGFTGAIENGVQYQTVFPFSLKRTEDGMNFGGFGNLGALGAATQGPFGPVALEDAWKYNYDPGDVTDPWDDDVDTSVPDYSSTYSLGTLSFASLQAILQIVNQSTDIQMVQAPEIVALDNQEATIHVGRVIRYAEFYSETTDGGVVSGYREATPLVAGVQLVVVPHVCGADGNVILEVVPKTEDFDGFETFGQGTANEVRLPQTRTKVVVTKMRLKNRETGVIAGLLTDQTTDSIRKIPILGDLPVIGYAFKRKSHTQSKSNMLVLITPTIIQGSDREDFGDQIDRIRELADFSTADVSMAR